MNPVVIVLAISVEFQRCDTVHLYVHEISYSIHHEIAAQSMKLHGFLIEPVTWICGPPNIPIFKCDEIEAFKISLIDMSADSGLASSSKLESKLYSNLNTCLEV